MFDVLIKNGTVIDGTGRKGFRADLGIKDDAIYEIGDLSHEDAGEIIDAGGKCVAPGFIDVGTHSDAYWTIFSEPQQESLVSQGITTIIGGNCGSSLAPLLGEDAILSLRKWSRVDQVNVDWTSVKEFLDRLEHMSLGVNFGTLVGHSTLRRAFVEDESRALSEDESEQITHSIQKAMEEGAFGVSTGLVYTHGTLAGKAELLAVAQAVAKNGGVYATHLRNEMGKFRDATREALHISAETGVKTHISHFKVMGRFYWSAFEEMLQEIEEESRVGSDITFDIFPYTASGSVLYTLLPEWASRGGKNMMLARLKDPHSRRDIIEELRRKQLNYSKITISLARSGSSKTIEEMAEGRSIEPEEVILDLLLANEGRVIVFLDLVSEDNIRRAMQSQNAWIASDGVGYALSHKETGEHIHPRSFGAFPRVLAKYVREEKILSLEDAIYKMTGGPARTYEIRGRGTLEEGNFADVVVFDPETVRDEATFDNPYRYATGIDAVLVNGKKAFSGGSPSGVFSGKVLRKR